MKKRIGSWLMGALIIALVSSNVAMLTSASWYGAVFNSLSTVAGAVLPAAMHARVFRHSPAREYEALSKSYKTLNAQHTTLQQRMVRQTETAKRISTRVARRATTGAVKNAAAVPGESVPLVGAAAMVALTISDIYDACQTIKDMNELSTDFELVGSDETAVCGIKPPVWTQKWFKKPAEE